MCSKGKHVIFFLLGSAFGLWFGSLADCDDGDANQVWRLLDMGGSNQLSLADGSILALRDCDAFPGAQLFVGAGPGHCEQMAFSNNTSDSNKSVLASTSTINIALSWPRGWCIGIGREGGGPGVGVWPCDEPGQDWTTRAISIKTSRGLSGPTAGNSALPQPTFAFELQEPLSPLPRRCLAARTWGAPPHEPPHSALRAK